MEVFSQYFLITDSDDGAWLELIESSALLCHASSNDPLVLSIATGLDPRRLKDEWPPQ